MGTVILQSRYGKLSKGSNPSSPTERQITPLEANGVFLYLQYFCFLKIKTGVK